MHINEKIFNALKIIISDILKIDRNEIKHGGNFFELGGDSLKLTTLLHEIDKKFNVSLDIRILFKYSNFTELSKWIDFLLRHPKLQRPKSDITDENNNLPISFEQKQIWLGHNTSVNKSLYNVPWIMQINGKLDVQLLTKTLEKIVTNTEIFKLAIKVENNSPTSHVYNYVPLNFRTLDTNQKKINASIAEFINLPFNLEKPPLYRFCLFKLTNRYILCCVFHHIIVDSQSLRLFSEKIAAYYNNTKIIDKTNQYSSYIKQQNQAAKPNKSKQQEEYWKKCSTIATSNTANLPKINSYINTNKCSISFAFDSKLISKAETYIKKKDLTFFAFFFTVFGLVAGKLIRQNKFAISLPISTRTDTRFSKTIGLFINLLPYVYKTDLEQTFSSHLLQINKELRKLYRFSNLSHDDIVKITGMAHDDFAKLLNIAFTVDSLASPNLKNLQTKVLDHPYNSHKFDLTFFLRQTDDEYKVLIEFNPKLFSKSIITSIFDSFCYMTQHVLSHDNTMIKHIPLIPQTKIAINTNKTVNKYNTILDMFEEIIAKHGNSIAIKNNDKEISFLELNKQSNQFANYLKTQGFKHGDIFAISLNHSIELIVCIIGILKLGCSYVPVDPSMPQERTKYIIDAAKPKLTITSHNINEFFSTKDNYSSKLAVKLNQNDLAYIIFTSGSTGKPKGCMINHNNLLNLFAHAKSVFDFNNNDCWILLHSYSFDFSVWEIFGALLHGSKLLIPDKQLIKSPEYLFRLITECGVTVLNQTPSAFNSFSIEASKHIYEKKLPLRYIIFGGEAIHNKVILAWYKNYPAPYPKLVNMYGITEGTIHVTWQILDENIIKNNYYGTPIGKPLAGCAIALLDEQHMKPPIGFCGEIYLCGNNIAQGYVNEKKLTSERFIKLKNLASTTLYKTGDLAIQNNDGTFSYIGRNDSQVKIRGYRVEPEEVNGALLASEYLSDATVILDNSDPKYSSLTAFLVPNTQKGKTVYKLQKYLDKNALHFTELPNNVTVADINSNETLSLYDEIFVTKQYLQHGVNLNKNPIVLDIGANIGLFSLSIGLMRPSAKIYAFEPFENLCACIKANAEIYNINLVVDGIGISNVSEIKKFSYFDNVTSMSNYCQNHKAQSKLLKSVINSNNKDAVNAIIDKKLEHKFLNCKVETISEQIKKHSITHIDLLKIDVEGAELDVLNGITETDWNIIHQIVIEVHNSSFLEPIINLLESHNYNIVVDKLDKFKNSELYVLYATQDAQNTDSTLTTEINIPLTKSTLLSIIKQHLADKLPDYIRPTKYYFIQEIPKTINGKIDHTTLGEFLEQKNQLNTTNQIETGNIAKIVLDQWKKTLGKQATDKDRNFFEAGGTSILAIQLAAQLSEKTATNIRVLDIFTFPTIQKLTAHIERILNKTEITTKSHSNQVKNNSEEKIAIIGIEGRFPKANSAAQFWENLVDGKNCVTDFSDSEYPLPKIESFIPKAGVIDNPYDFAAGFFQFPPLEARIMDPQQRLLLEISYLALKNAGIESTNSTSRIGVFASCDQSKYRQIIDTNELESQSIRLIDYANSRDFIATRISYKLGLTGPAITTTTACSSSLTSITQAIKSLRNNECDIALVCSSSLVLPEILPGYFHETDGIMSKDGRCCPFDVTASGTVPSSAVSAIILKREQEAINNEDTVIALINSFAINNDGNDKAAFFAPSPAGQQKCLREIYNNLEDKIEKVGFIETHGTGTKIGDAVEIEALTAALSTKKTNIPLGSVKANIGHTGATSGLCGLIKAALILNKKIIPPQINFTKWNEHFENTSKHFNIITKQTDLASNAKYAGVSSFGMGGTNIHVLLETSTNKRETTSSVGLEIFGTRETYNSAQPASYYKKEKVIKYANLANLKHLDIIKKFLQIIADELELTEVKLEDNFFDLGGDSMIALGVLSKISQNFNVVINIEDFYQAKNLEDLISIMLKKDDQNKARCKVLKDGENLSIILIHSGGGNVYQYNFLKDLNLNNAKIITIENQVLNDLSSPLISIEKMAHHYISLLDPKVFKGRFILAGWSFGGSVSYEMAHQLQTRGIKAEKVIMLDSWAKHPNQYTEFNDFANIWYKRLEKIYHYEDKLWKKMLWNRLKMLINYTPPASNIDVILYKAKEVDLEMVTKDHPSNFWDDYTNNVKTITVNAKHQNILYVMRDNNLFADFLNYKD